MYKATKLLPHCVRISRPNNNPSWRFGVLRVTNPYNRSLSTLAEVISLAKPPTFDFTFDNLVDLQHQSSARYPNNRIFGTRKGDKYEWMTYKEFDQNVNNTRKLLHKAGLGYDDKVAIISSNRWEWAAFSYGIQGLGGQIVPMYEAQTQEDWQFIVEDSNAKLLVAATTRIYDIVKDYAGKVGQVKHVVCLDAPESESYSYQYLLKEVSSLPEVPRSSKVNADHLSTLIYTSGTTGKPKGVELTHGNIAANVIGGRLIANRPPQRETSLAFLPWAHVYGLTSELHSLVSSGSALALVPHRDQILECLMMVKPNVIMSVPVVYNKIYDGIMKAMAKQPPNVQYLFKLAMSTARSRNAKLEYGKWVNPFLELKHRILDRIVLKKLRDRIGGNIEMMASGGAATPLPVLQFFEDIGTPILEGYGLTETAPMISAGAPGWEKRRLGCVGVALPGIDIKIVDPDTLQDVPHDTDGEITCCGPNVMRGYHNRPEDTKEVFFYRGDKRYFRTGDLGRLVEGKFLKITGRIKEQFKLENGKYVVPAPLEDIYQRGPYIQQAYLYGADRPHTILLIVPNYAEIANWAKDTKQEDVLKMVPTALDIPNLKDNNMKLFKNEEFVHLIDAEVHTFATQSFNTTIYCNTHRVNRAPLTILLDNPPRSGIKAL